MGNGGFEFGIQGNPNQQFAVDFANSNVDEIVGMRKLLPRWEHLAQPGSNLQALLDLLPAGPVDLRCTLDEGLWTAYVFLDEIGQVTRQQRPSAPPVILSSLRAALLASARVLYALLPDSPESIRLDRATKVMRQEANSLTQLYEQADALRQGGFVNLPPQADVAASLRVARRLGARSGTPPPREAAMLREVAKLMGHLPTQEGGFAGLEPTLLAMFNVTSGIVHGYGWPTLLWRVGDLPTNAPGDFMLTSILTHVAHRLVLEESGIGVA